MYANGIDKIWAADLVEMGRFGKWNDDVCYLLMVIDVFSKFGWIELLRNNKKVQSIVKAFNIMSRNILAGTIFENSCVTFVGPARPDK